MSRAREAGYAVAELQSRFIAFVTEAGSIKRILEYLGQPTTPPPITRPITLACGPPRLETMTSIKRRSTTRRSLSERRTMSLIRPSPSPGRDPRPAQLLSP
ncbi:MAG: hypothetical protein ACREU8_05440 [Gammaproteobacteria bacterium]